MSMKRVIRVGLIGCGTVGGGVVKLLQKNREIIRQRIGADVEIVKIAVKHLNKRRPVRMPAGCFTTKVNEVLHDPSIDIVVEVMGGEQPALTYMLEAMKWGKHVVTANKKVLAKHWVTLMGTAKRNGVDLYLEASVGGGMPLIQALHDGLASNRVQSLYGIVNGTTNYVLTRMEEGLPYPEAVAEAQARGFAEADPTDDVEGFDSAHKLSILTAIAFNRLVPAHQIYTEGISHIPAAVLAETRQYLKRTVKLLAIARRGKAGLEARVHPTLIPDRHLLAAVPSMYNGVYITGDAVGPVMMYGQGAGEMPTASAVMSDMIFVARNVIQGVAGRVPSIHSTDHTSSLPLIPMEAIRTRYYLRVMVVDRPGMFAKLAAALGRHQISIATVIQLVEQRMGQTVPVALTTHEASEGAVRKAMKEIQRQGTVSGRPLVFRIEDID